MLVDLIEFENRQFAVRTLDLGEEFGICTVASEELNELLIDIDGNYRSLGAELVDEQIFFFTDRKSFTLPDDRLSEAVLGQIR